MVIRDHINVDLTRGVVLERYNPEFYVLKIKRSNAYVLYAERDLTDGRHVFVVEYVNSNYFMVSMRFTSRRDAVEYIKRNADGLRLSTAYAASHWVPRFNCI